MKRYLALLFALTMLAVMAQFGVSASALGPTADATITIDATQPGFAISPDLWGTNLTHNANATETVENPVFVAAAGQTSVTLVRWPGGNNADAYDWKRDEIIKPGRRVQSANKVDMPRLLEFLNQIEAEPSITINFGTMNAQDAADLVEFLNGPADSTWGAQRAALGFPEPVGVRYFEIGNEINQPHMWYYAWTAENPVKYFFGGGEERRGRYNNAGSQEYDPVGAKGDFFKVGGGPNQVYYLRFPPVRDVQVLWFATREDVENEAFEKWKRVDDLSTQGADAKVYELDEAEGVLRFGDGVHGAIPPAESFFLVEYTTYDHDGYLDFVRAMRAAPSSVPIQIGAAMLPFTDTQPITDANGMREIFEAMDFYVRHQYNASFPVAYYDSYDARRQIPTMRVDILRQVYARVRQYMKSIGVDKPLGVAVTEWNIFLNQDHWEKNLTLEGGVLAAEWFIRLLNAGKDAPVFYANQFALGGGNLSLVRSVGNNSIAPMGYVFQGFANWPGHRVLPITVDSPSAIAYDQLTPYVAAAAALSADGETLLLAVVNNAENETLDVAVQISGFEPASAQMWRLQADAYWADNKQNPTNVALQEQPPPSPLTQLALPPHSVTFVEWRADSAPCANESCRLYLPQLFRADAVRW
ncbi:MAG: hypothetical protein GXP42_15085 [Chloroflexi bacterium]|nr:hypothetical protein [Chloroflexota bacterium]